MCVYMYGKDPKKKKTATRDQRLQQEASGPTSGRTAAEAALAEEALGDGVVGDELQVAPLRPVPQLERHLCWEEGRRSVG